MATHDSRSPQEKGKPAHRTAHTQVGRPQASGKPAVVPNRSGSPKHNLKGGEGDGV
jgi:hypothetical protein